MTDPLEAPIGKFLSRVFDDTVEVVSIARLSGGASQETYRVEALIGIPPNRRTFALRRAWDGRERDPHGDFPDHPGLPMEAELFRIAKGANIPEPEVLAVLKPNDDLGPGFLLEWLSGETLGGRIVHAEKFASIRPSLARQCGDILGRLHAIDVHNTGLSDHLRVMHPEQFVCETWSNYQALPTVQPMIDYTALWLLDNLPKPCAAKLVHNDFRNGNLMVDPERGIIAVLDWELAHLGDPMRDLGWLCCNSWRFGSALPVGGFGTREDLLAGYSSSSELAISQDPAEFWEQVKFWEVFGSFWWAVGTLLMGQHYRDNPGSGIERAAIARRTSECQMDCVNLLFPGSFEIDRFPRDDKDPDSLNDLAQSPELIAGVRDFLRRDVLQDTAGRTKFLARVSANLLDLVAREQALGTPALAAESSGLRELGFAPSEHEDLERASTVQQQRNALVAALKSGAVGLNNRPLQKHLRKTVAQQLAIDQPSYSALKHSC